MSTLINKMRRYSVIVFIAFVFLLGGDAKKVKRRKTKEVTTVNLTSTQYCRSCKLFVERYLPKAISLAKGKDKAEFLKEDGTLDGNKAAHAICANQEYDEYKDFMRYGCMKIAQDDEGVKKVIKKFDGMKYADVTSTDIMELKKKVRLIPY